MTTKEVLEWLTDERLDRINHDRERAGEEPATKAAIARRISLLTGFILEAVISRYE